VESHSGKLIFGQLAGRQVVVMQGRFHFYEGYSMEQVVFPVRVMKLLGIRKLFVSNAGGGLNPDFHTSDLMVITDHINLQPFNPLIGPNKDDLGPRFPDMSEVYDEAIIREAQAIAQENDLPLQTGVYVSVPGPMLETKAEYRYLTGIGADAVGMSTVPEIIAARHMGLPCFAVSVITDMCVPGKIKKVVLLDILEAAAKAEPNMTLLIKELIRRQA
jgi:purine-nucleoside phosphorylase